MVPIKLNVASFLAFQRFHRAAATPRCQISAFTLKAAREYPRWGRWGGRGENPSLRHTAAAQGQWKRRREQVSVAGNERKCRMGATFESKVRARTEAVGGGQRAENLDFCRGSAPG